MRRGTCSAEGAGRGTAAIMERRARWRLGWGSVACTISRRTTRGIRRRKPRYPSAPVQNLDALRPPRSRTRLRVRVEVRRTRRERIRLSRNRGNNGIHLLSTRRNRRSSKRKLRVWAPSPSHKGRWTRVCSLSSSRCRGLRQRLEVAEGGRGCRTRWRRTAVGSSVRSAVGLRQCRPERPLELAEVAVEALGILLRVEVGGRPLGVRVDSVVVFHYQQEVEAGVRREEDPDSPWVHYARGADGTRVSVPQ